MKKIFTVFITVLMLVFAALFFMTRKELSSAMSELNLLQRKHIEIMKEYKAQLAENLQMKKRELVGRYLDFLIDLDESGKIDGGLKPEELASAKKKLSYIVENLGALELSNEDSLGLSNEDSLGLLSKLAALKSKLEK